MMIAVNGVPMLKTSWALVSYAQPSEAAAAVREAKDLDVPEWPDLVVRLVDEKQVKASTGGMGKVVEAKENSGWRGWMSVTTRRNPHHILFSRDVEREIVCVFAAEDCRGAHEEAAGECGEEGGEEGGKGPEEGRLGGNEGRNQEGADGVSTHAFLTATCPGDVVERVLVNAERSGRRKRGGSLPRRRLRRSRSFRNRSTRRLRRRRLERSERRSGRMRSSKRTSNRRTTT